MTDWKEAPHLFCNGEFKCLSRANEYPCKIEGYDSDREELIVERRGIEVESCTLIARPIESMTDEELESYANGQLTEREKGIYREWLKNEHEDSILDHKRFLYLLSIGVYPFDQSHFGDSVINANEIEEV